MIIHATTVVGDINHDNHMALNETYHLFGFGLRIVVLCYDENMVFFVSSGGWNLKLGAFYAAC